MTLPPSLVWLPADHRALGKDERTMPFLVLGEKYARAAREAVGVQPVMFPLADASQIAELLACVDGVMLTGSPSNVHPSHFGGVVADPALSLDVARDSLTLPLIQACVEHGVPLLGICRGFQEINVAMGGTLHQKVHAVAGMQDHREDTQATYDEQYAPSHLVHLVAGGRMVEWAQGASSVMVNSLHGQGVDRLADSLQPLAMAQDGLVEAFEIKNAKAFAVAVQWHPEWKSAENPFYSATMAAFGQACKLRYQQRILGKE